jgi:hypothetical protein
MEQRQVVIDCRRCEGMKEILRRAQKRLTQPGRMTSLDRDDLLDSISAHLAPPPQPESAVQEAES